MLSQVEQTLLLNTVVIVVAVIFAFTIISTLMALTVALHLPVPSAWSWKTLAFESVESTKSAIARKQCRAWAEKKRRFVV